MRMRLDMKRLLNIGVDNALVNTDVNGVFKTMRREWQLLSLIMARHMCHSLQLALSHAVQGTLLRNADFLVQEVQRANKAYERNDADPARLLEDLTLPIKTVCSKVLTPTTDIDSPLMVT